MPKRSWLALSVAVILLAASPAFAQRDLKNIPDPDPELERKALELADGFEVNLFAADPQIAKPIQMNFDPQGRLWIASSEVYPQIAPGQKANDRILVVEDVDGDGKADKTTVFASGLLIPTAVEPGDGGAYVANSTELVHFKDTDGDGKADTSRVVLSGFGTEDTHHILHTFRWGPDGMLYMNQSIYIHSHIETPYGVRRLNAGGIWQFRPETMRLDIFARGWINTWGHQLDEYGQSFATDGAGGEGINFVVPGAAYPTATLIPRILHGLNPGSPKYCGMEFVGGRHLPDDWQGNVITNDFRGHRVCRFALSDDGSAFTAKQLPDLIKSNHPAFRPIDIKMGPDGAIYIADWYNPIIQHGEVDFRDPRRDHVHGRIWRVTAKGRPLVPKPELVDATAAELFEALKSPELWTRHQAKRVIKERHTIEQAVTASKVEKSKRRLASSSSEFGNGPGGVVTRGQEANKGRQVLAEAQDQPEIKPTSKIQAVPRLESLRPEQLKESFKNLDATDPLIERHKLEFLWTYQSIDHPHPELLTELLRAKDFRVRAAATRVIGHWADRLPNALELLAAQVADEHPRVRLEAVRVLGSIRDPQSFVLALRVLNNPVDQWIDYAAWMTCRELESLWLPKLREGTLSLGSESRHLPFALKAVNSPAVVPSLVQLVKEKRVAANDLPNVLALIAELGNAAELRPVFELAVAEGTAPADAAALLSGLAGAATKRGVTPEGDLAVVERLAGAEAGVPDAVQAAALRAVGAWKREPARGALIKVAMDTKASLALRLAAVEGVQSLGGAASVETLVTLTARNIPREVRAAAATALGFLDAKRGAEAAVLLLQDMKESPDDAEPVVLAALARKEGAAALATALDVQPLPPDVAKVALRTLSAAGRSHPELEAAFRTAGGITGKAKILSPEEMAALVAEVKEKGDPAAGELVFRRKALGCQKCHAIGGAGGTVGPDLVSIGASAQVDYLIDSLLVPNKQVKEGFQTVVVETNDGRVVTGIKVRQTDADLILRTIEDKEINVPLKSIEDQTNGTTLMPVGLTDATTHKEFVDLVRFLSELGKVGPFAVPRANVVRHWEAAFIPQDKTRDLASLALGGTNDESFTRLVQALAWEAAFSKVSGGLPWRDYPLLRTEVGKETSPNGGSSSTGVVRFHLLVSQPGVVVLKFQGHQGLSGRIDGKAFELKDEVPLELGAGRHTVTFVASANTSPDQTLRVELSEGADTTAKARLEGRR
jgi:putative heme-binding domain-containing protein